MSVDVVCPECGMCLTVRDQHQGRSVACSGCKHVFVPPGQPDIPVASILPPAPPTPRSQARTEDNPFAFDEGPLFRTEQAPLLDLDPEAPEDEPPRTLLSHRGGLIVAMGALSLLLFIPPIGFGLGTMAVKMAEEDLRAMRRKLMDPQGRRATQIGERLGAAGMILSGGLAVVLWAFRRAIFGSRKRW